MASVSEMYYAALKLHNQAKNLPSTMQNLNDYPDNAKRLGKPNCIRPGIFFYGVGSKNEIITL